MSLISELRELLKQVQENPVGFGLAGSITLTALLIYHLLASTYWFASANDVRSAASDITKLASQIDDIEKQRSENYSYTAKSTAQMLAHLKYNLEAIELLEEACKSTERYSKTTTLPQELRAFVDKCEEYEQYAQRNKNKLEAARDEITFLAKRLQELSQRDEPSGEAVAVGKQGLVR